MGRLLYVSFGNASTPGRGVTKKINSQLKVFQASGMDTVLLSGYNDQLAVYYGNAEVEPALEKLPGGTRNQLASWVKKHARDFNYAYIRFQFFDFFFEQMLKSLKKNGAKIVVEIPTYPYIGELKAQGKKGIPKIIIDRFFRNGCIKHIDGFTSPAYEGMIFSIPVIPMRNGIDMDSVSVRVPSPERQEGIVLLAVSSMSPWHGFERILQGISDYFNNGGKRNLFLHLVGEGVELERYKSLAQSLHLQDHVKFWGRLSGTDLDRMYEFSDIGVCSLGIHKLGIAKSNTLKTLEYLAKGMPIICEESEAGIDLDNEYRLNVPSDDSPINVDNIVGFYDSIYGKSEPGAVISKVRKVCSEQCSTEAAMKDVTKYFLG